MTFLALAVTVLVHPALALSGGAVHGTHFRPHESVRVNVVAPRFQRVVRSSSTGRFVVTLPAAIDPCNDTVVITAVGATGDSAHLKIMARGCLPQSTP